VGTIHDFVTLNELSDAPAARNQSCQPTRCWRQALSK
jgi:hypothetical protein